MSVLKMYSYEKKFHISSFYDQVCVISKLHKLFMTEKYLQEDILITETYSETCQTSKLKRIAKLVNGYNQGSNNFSFVQCFNTLISIKYFIVFFIIKFVDTERLPHNWE